MVSFKSNDAIDIEDQYTDLATFERIRPQRETPMPVGSSRSQSKGRRRSSPPNRAHKTPSHCRGAALRHVRKWR